MRFNDLKNLQPDDLFWSLPSHVGDAVIILILGVEGA